MSSATSRSQTVPDSTCAIDSGLKLMVKSKVKRAIAPEPAPTVLPGARSALNIVIGRFVQDSRHKTLLVKGKWGVGKTHAVRGLLLGEDGPASTVSYVSLSGISKIGDERLLVVSGLEREGGQQALEKYSLKFTEVAKTATKMIPLSASGVADAGLDALQGFLASRVVKGAIVVLDDIERREQGLSLSTVFGAISRLTEVREAKVIVIMNEDELATDPESAKLLSHQREKIFDREFEYRPSPDEQLRLLDLKKTAEYVKPVATKLKIINLRVLQKTAWVVEELAARLADVDAAIRSRLLAQLAQIAAIRFLARNPLSPKDLESGLHFQLLDAVKNRRDASLEEPENPFRWDLESLDYSALSVDPILLAFLESGIFDESGFKAVLPDLAALHAEEKFQRQREAISASIWGKFEPLTPDELGLIRSLLDGDEIAKVGAGDLQFYLDILQMHGLALDKASYELKWAQRVPIAHGGLSEFRFDRLKTEEAKNMIRARVNAAQDPQAPQTLKEALDCHRLSATFLQSAEATDRAAIEKILKETTRKDLLTDLTILFREATIPGQLLPEIFELAPPFAAAISDVLDNLSAESEINKIRVNAIRPS
jgi:hypothetical protein